jgi:transposase
MARPRKYPDELRRRSVEEVLDRGGKIPEVAARLGIASSETLRNWVRQAEIDRGLKQGPTTEELAEIKRLRKEVADLQRSNEILKAATAFMWTPRLCGTGSACQASSLLAAGGGG